MKKPNNIQLKNFAKRNDKLAFHFQNTRRVYRRNQGLKRYVSTDSVCSKNVPHRLLSSVGTAPSEEQTESVPTYLKCLLIGLFYKRHRCYRTCFIALFCVLFLAGCAEKPTEEELRAQQEYSELMNSFRFPYSLVKPTQVYKLPEVLREISGLGITSTGELGCIQDELGVIFIYDTDQCEINRRIGYGRSADYEGVTFVGDDAFALRTNGNIYRILAFDGGQPVRQKHKSLLNRKNNTKGITHEPNKNRILAICKDGYAIEDNFVEQLAIYAYDIDSNTVADSVAYSLDIDQVKAYAKLAAPESYREVFPMFFKSNLTIFPIYPSALAVHPKTGDIYIASGAGGLLFILNSDGVLVHIERLREDSYLQIEGLTFQLDGTLLMASEGQKGRLGQLYEFEIMYNE